MERTINVPKLLDRQTDEDFAAEIMALEQNLYRVALSLMHQPALAEDAVAEAVYKAYASRHRLRDREKLKPWLFQILVNQCRTMQRKQGREVPLAELPKEPAQQDPQSGLWDLVRRLPDSQQSVIVLYYYEGYSVREIAKLLRLKEGTVRVRMNRGRETLRQWMED